MSAAMLQAARAHAARFSQTNIKLHLSKKQHKVTMQIVVATVKTLLVVYDKNKTE